MGFWLRLLGYEDEKKPDKQPPKFRNENIPDALDIGLHFSEAKNEVQVAKVSEQDRATHLYVIGASGSGKTKLLEGLIRQDIHKGNGFCVIDPHGDLIRDVIDYIVCRHGDDPAVLDRVIIIDPTDPKYSVAFNPLEVLPGISAAEQAEELLCCFRKIWSDSWGVRMESLLRNSLIALGEAGLTLCELVPFLTRRAYREVALEKVDNPTAIEYFRRFDSLTSRGQITWVEPVLNKIDAFLADERMRHMFSSPKSTFNLREAMDAEKHILIKLDKGTLKGASDLLGSLLMAKIQMAAFSRSSLRKGQRVPFYLYVDEFQNFATESFKIVISEARKYGLSLVMANQSLSQIPDDLKSLILGSAGIQVYFRVNRQDAQTLAKEAFSYSGNWERDIEELQHLRPRNFYLKHKIQGGVARLQTLDVKAVFDGTGVERSDLPPLGMKYMLQREDLIAQASQRQRAIEEVVKAKTQSIPEKPVVSPNLVSGPVPIENTDWHDNEESKPIKHSKQSRDGDTLVSTSIELLDIPIPGVKDVKIEREHRRIQHLIKKLAEQCGYLAIIEQPTTDCRGRIDVGLERDGKKIACEVSVTTSPEHELSNIRKCLKSEYELVILCSPEKKSLVRIKALCTKELSASELKRVFFLEPDKLVLFFEEEAAKNAGKTDKVKGYKVNVNFQPLGTDEKKSKRQAVAQIVLRSFRRDKQNK